MGNEKRIFLFLPKKIGKRYYWLRYVVKFTKYHMIYFGGETTIMEEITYRL